MGTILKIDEVKALLVPVVTHVLGKDTVEHIAVYDKIAFDGDKMIQVYVSVRGGLETYDPGKALEALSAANDALNDAGDDRFVSMLPVFEGDEPGENDGPIPDGDIGEH